MSEFFVLSLPRVNFFVAAFYRRESHAAGGTKSRTYVVWRGMSEHVLGY